MFSRRSIVEFQPVVREKVEILCQNIAKFGQGGKVVDMRKAWSAFAGDVICQYSFGYSYDHLESQDFGEGFHDAFMAVSTRPYCASVPLGHAGKLTNLIQHCNHI
jgi:hypothetical protein